MFHLRQRMRRAQDFALDFRTLAASAGWNERALIDHYWCSLREDVRRELACRDTTLTLDQLVDLYIRLDNLLATADVRIGPVHSIPQHLRSYTYGARRCCSEGDRRGGHLLHHMFPRKSRQQAGHW